MRRLRWVAGLGLLWLLCVAESASAIEPAATELPSAEGGQRQISTFRLPPGFRAELFATDPQLGSPVAIGLDEQNRVYVAEEYRFNRGTEENRTRPFLLEDDLQIQTLDDRLQMFRKYADRFEGGMDWFTRHADQVRQLTDTNGDGVADRSTVFAGGFNGPLDGLAAGVMARDGDVFLTCIPSLWRLRDADGDGVAEVREAVHTGFGVNAAFLGHDLHGLCWGPDGKLYFSVGDRGFHVQTREGETLSGPRTGAVFRCYPDGTELEVVHRGLRNPQELAFDEWGNLFAADNNCDKGDHSRLVYVMEGGESGWNMAYQSIPDPYLTGPWHAEGLWHLPHPGQPAYIVPPAGKLGAGPSGFCFYPGTGLPESYRGRFFLCNFTGNGGLEAITVQPRGAGFEVTAQEDFLKPVFATDAEFGYDGKLYVSDFVGLDWEGASRGGRIYTVQHPEVRESALVQDVQQLFLHGFQGLETDRLMGLLSHADQRVRMRAQFELARRGDAVRDLLLQEAHTGQTLPGRIHAIWALGQFRGEQSAIQAGLLPLLNDGQPEVRAQTAKVFGQQRWTQANSAMVGLLADPELRVRSLAATALGRNRYQPAGAPLVQVLRENRDVDPFLRHAVVQALSEINDAPLLSQMQRDPEPAVRVAALLVWRKQRDPQLAVFLRDADPALVTEAARAINDLPLEAATQELAGLLPNLDLAVASDPLLRRVLNANYRLGTQSAARGVVRVVLQATVSDAVRREALAMLSEWSHPGARDRVTGFWRPLAVRDPATVNAVLQESTTDLLTQTSGTLQLAVVELVTREKLPIDTELFYRWAVDAERDVRQRMAALSLLVTRDDPRSAALLEAALQSDQPLLRVEARELTLRRQSEQGIALLAEAWNAPQTTLFEKQQALQLLATLETPAAHQVLQQALQSLSDGQLAAELQVDVIEAIHRRNVPALTDQLQHYRQKLEDQDARLGWFRTALRGGDAEQGRRIFRGHTTAQCFRCHKIQGSGGDAGPDLSAIGQRGTREHILESLIAPDAKLAPGFGAVAYILTDGRVVAGLLKAEDDRQVTIVTPEGQTVVIPVDEIEERTAAKSAMPPMGTVLKLNELRDVIEYLSSLK